MWHLANINQVINSVIDGFKRFWIKANFHCSCQSVLWRCWLGVRTGIRPVKTEWWGAVVVICLERGADLHMAQLTPLPLTVSSSSKIQIGFTFLVPAHLGSPVHRAVKWVCTIFLNSRLKAKCGSILSLSVSVSKFAMVIFKYPTTF